MAQYKQAGEDYLIGPQPKAGPCLLHCATGTRAALMLTLVRARQHGWGAQGVFDEAEAMSFPLRSSEPFAKFVRDSALS